MGFDHSRRRSQHEDRERRSITQQATCGQIDPGTAQRSSNPGPGPFGLAWRAGTEQGRLRKPASGESRFMRLGTRPCSTSPSPRHKEDDMTALAVGSTLPRAPMICSTLASLEIGGMETPGLRFKGQYDPGSPSSLAFRHPLQAIHRTSPGEPWSASCSTYMN
jgi:hypothetical protein